MLHAQDLTPSEYSLFSEILWKLGTEKGHTQLRQNIIADIATLLRADFAASYIWDTQQHSSQHGIMWRIDPKALEEYEHIWQHDDPITARLRNKQKPTFVHEIISLAELKKTTYYNEFLKPYGMYHGLNVYFIQNGFDVGDLRIWRAEDAAAFSDREKRILNILEPYITQALPMNTSFQYSLTPREYEIATLVSKGLNDKEVASLLHIGFTTVRTHLKSVMRKMGCNNRTEMAMLMKY